MPKQVDGIITVNTELSTKGFKAGSQELKQAIKSLNTKMNALGPIFQKALSGNTKAMSDLNAKSSALKNTIAGIEKDMRELAEIELPTDHYKFLTDELQKAEKKLGSYLEKQDRMEALGTKETSKEWRTNQYEIDLATQKIKEYELEMEGMRDAKTAFKPGAATEEYAKLSADLARAKSALQSMSLEEKNVAQSATPVPGIFAKAKSYFSALKTEMQKAPPLTEQLRSGMTAVGKALYKVAQIIELPITGLMLLPTVAKWGAQAIGVAFNNIGVRISSIVAAARGKFAALAPVIKSAFADPIGTARTLFSSLNQKAGSVVVAVRKIGSSILSGTVSGLRQAVTSGAGLARSLGGKALSGVKRLGGLIKTGLANGLKKSVGLAKRFFSSMRKDSGSSGGAISKLGKKITGLGGMLKRMALRKIVSSIFNGAKEGFNNLAQYSSGVNGNLSTLKSGLTQLKNSFATAFAPVLNVVTPILSKLIGYLSQAATYVGKLFAALTGQKNFTKAKAVQEDYAASLKDTSKASKEAKNQLASFDEANTLNDSSSSSDNGNDGNASVSEMFEEVPIESSITDFMGRIKDAFKNGNFAEIGEILGNGINTAIQKVQDFISWDNVGGTVTKVIKGVAEGFNSLIYTIDWENIGSTVAQGLNTVLNTLYLIVTEFDWPAVAAALARSLNGLVSDFDWTKLGTLISTGFITAIKSLRSAISTFDWMSLGKGIADSINAIDWVGVFSELAGLLSDAIVGLLDLCIGFMEGIDWGKLGSDLWNSLVGIIKNIDWGALVSKAFQLLGNVIGASYSIVFGLANSVWETIVSAFENTVSYFKDKISEHGGNIIEGIFNGIVDWLKDVGKWIRENIWDPFVEGFKNTFDIHSPSRDPKIVELGSYLIEGVFNGIKDWIKGIKDWFKENVFSKITDAWNGMKELTVSIGGKIQETFTNLKASWDSVKDKAATLTNNVKEGVKNALSNLKSNWDGIKDKAATLTNNVKEGVKGALSTLKSNWGSIKDKTATLTNKIKENVKGALSTLKSNWGSIKDKTATLTNKVKEGAKGALSTLKSNWGSIKDKTATLTNKVKEGAKGALGTLKSNWNNIKSKTVTVTAKATDKASSVFKNIANGFIDYINKAIDKINSKLKISIGSTLSKVLNAVGVKVSNGSYQLFSIPKIPKLAKGGIANNPGKGITATIGEAGPEAVLPLTDKILGKIASMISDRLSGAVDPKVIPVRFDGVEAVLDVLSDKISSGFDSLIDRLRAIAENVTFTMPQVAIRGVVPYSVSAKAGTESKSPEGFSIDEASMTKFADKIASSVGEQLKHLNGPINLSVNLDSRKIESRVIELQNKRAFALNKGGAY